MAPPPCASSRHRRRDHRCFFFRKSTRRSIPYASSKANALAERLIGSTPPSPDERRDAPHHLVETQGQECSRCRGPSDLLTDVLLGSLTEPPLQVGSFRIFPRRYPPQAKPKKLEPFAPVAKIRNPDAGVARRRGVALSARRNPSRQQRVGVGERLPTFGFAKRSNSLSLGLDPAFGFSGSNLTRTRRCVHKQHPFQPIREEVIAP